MYKLILSLVLASGVFLSPCVSTAINLTTWMTDNLVVLGDKTLPEISIPYSHDAGMYRSVSCSEGGFTGGTCNTQTQQFTIGEQLARGVRMFDLRPIQTSSGVFSVGHFTKIDHKPLNCVGGCLGGDMETIFTDIATFAQQNPHELIILYFSHYYDQTAEGADINIIATHEMKVAFIEYVKEKLGPYLFKIPPHNMSILRLKYMAI